MIRARAYAKLNLCLEVLDRRDDGYHEIAAVLQAVSLYDDLTVETAGDLSLECDDPSLRGPDNLVLRAAEALQAEAGVRQGARLVLDKRIPAAAGLGGGSADCAAALLALDRLWGTHRSREDLVRIGAGLGSDVPFFLSGGGTALVESRGERVTPLGLIPRAWAVIAVPSVPVPERKTAALYGMLRREHYTDGARACGWASGFHSEALWTTLLLDPGVYNVFDDVAPQAYPGIESAWAIFRDAVASAKVHLAGSGPALFALFAEGVGAEDSGARAVQAKLQDAGLQAFLVHTVADPVELEG